MNQSDWAFLAVVVVGLGVVWVLGRRAIGRGWLVFMTGFCLLLALALLWIFHQIPVGVVPPPPGPST